MIPRLSSRGGFPAVEQALREPDGLLAVGGDLGVARLIDAYRHGIFPWYAEGQPILWWSPDPRMVLFVDEFTASRSLRRRIHARQYEIRVDTAFEAVIRACAAPRDRQSGTWITAAMIDAYIDLHAAGFAHSIEAWREGALVGGLYGVALGRVFFGESMFARAPDASKVALAHLVAIAKAQRVPLIDCQQQTAHLASLGARTITRAAFAATLRELIHSIEPPPGWKPGPAEPSDL